jgi:hypothetical protein
MSTGTRSSLIQDGCTDRPDLCRRRVPGAARAGGGCWCSREAWRQREGQSVPGVQPLCGLHAHGRSHRPSHCPVTALQLEAAGFGGGLLLALIGGSGGGPSGSLSHWAPRTGFPRRRGAADDTSAAPLCPRGDGTSPGDAPGPGRPCGSAQVSPCSERARAPLLQAPTISTLPPPRPAPPHSSYSTHSQPSPPAPLPALAAPHTVPHQAHRPSTPAPRQGNGLHCRRRRPSGKGGRASESQALLACRA